MRRYVHVMLTAYNMGDDATEADFDAWASWVAAHIDDACDIDADVEQYAFSDGQGQDKIRCDDEEVKARVRRWLSNEGWNDFCAVIDAINYVLTSRGER